MPLSSVVGAQSIVRPGVCTSSTRPASPYDGQVIYETDTDRIAAYNGSAWQIVGSGLVFLTAVTFTNQTTVAFADSLFSSTYRNYQVFLECDPVTTGNTWTMQLRTNAGVANAAQYVGGLIGTSFTGGTANVGTNLQTAFNLGSTTVDQNNLAMTVFNPNANDRQTSWSGTVFNNSASDLGGAFGGTYMTVGAYTGLQFNFSSAVTGTYRVYGLADA